MTYYVSTRGKDSNSGSSDRPWRTIQHAVSTWVAGDTVIVMDGDYLESVSNSRSGTASSRLHLVAQNRWGAKIKGDGVGIYNSGNYVDIDGFEVTQPDITTENGTGDGILSQGSYNRYRYNYVHDKHSPYGADGFGGINLHGYNSSGWTQQGNEVSHNLVHDIGPLRAGRSLTDLNVQHGQGIYVSEKGAFVFDNLIYNTGRSGINTWHGALQATIYNNTVFEALRDGILIGCGDDGCVSSNDYTVVYNNISVHNHSTGIVEYGSTGTHNSYKNNLVYSNPTNISLQHGLTATATVTADPQFVNYQPTAPFTSTAYHLTATSPAIDVGSSSNAPSDDLDLGPRPHGKGFDIGAYEYGVTPGPWPY